MRIFLKQAAVHMIGGNFRRTMHNILVWKLIAALKRITTRCMESAVLRSLKATLVPKTKLLFPMCS